MRKVICILILLIITSIGCTGRQIVLHPIDQTDIIAVKEGEQFTAPKDGFFLSSFYVAEVMDAKIN